VANEIQIQQRRKKIEKLNLPQPSERVIKKNTHQRITGENNRPYLQNKNL